ncbi:hypothetical protein [Pseudomonas sp. 31 E 6]|nr:hypothetical protein [Pseudomonas sp. 31 E 5]CRM07370.1 hypothetical protein [Pseudomonas sp. 31 E 6]
MLLPNQHRLLGLVTNQRNRVRDHLIPSLQRRNRNRLDRRWRTAQQQWFSRLDMQFQSRPHKVLGEQLQQPSHPYGLDGTQRLGAQAQCHAGARRRPNQQQIDQHLTGDFSEYFVHLRRRQQAYPTDHRCQVDEEQRLITKHQQTVGNRVAAERQQRIEFSLGDVRQQLLAVGLEIRQQLIHLRNVVPQVVERLSQTAGKRHALHRAALQRCSVGKLVPLGFESLGPFITQARFQLRDHRLIRRIQRLDVILGNVGIKGDLVFLVAGTFLDFKNAAGADGSMDGRSRRAAILVDGLQHYRRVADRHRPCAFEHVQQGERALGITLGDDSAGLCGRNRRD